MRRRIGQTVRTLIGLLVLVTTAPAQLGNLQPSNKYWEFWAEVEGGKPSVFRVALPRQKTLVAVGDTLYLLNKKNRILWKWITASPIWDAPVVDSDGTIYVVGADMLWAAVDSETGKQKWYSTVNGRGAFTQIKLYRKDMYLVVTDMWGYRDNLHDPAIKDSLSLCKRNAVLWDIEIPARTKLHVFGDTIFLTYKRHGHTVRRRISVPSALGKPISRISSLADHEGRPIIQEN